MIADQLDKKLPRGFKTQLAAKHKVSKSLVTYVLKNNLTSHFLFKGAIELRKAQKEAKVQEEKEMVKDIKSL
jgi:hypothetical protein